MPRVAATLVGISPDGTKLYRPLILVAIEVGARGVVVPALVDSGADNTLVPASFMETIGVPFSSLPPGLDGSGPGGDLQTRPCEGVMRWGQGGPVLMREWAVAEPDKGPDQVLLGRADFFKLYVTRFHWHKDPPCFDLDPVGDPVGPRQRAPRPRGR